MSTPIAQRASQRRTAGIARRSRPGPRWRVSGADGLALADSMVRGAMSRCALCVRKVRVLEVLEVLESQVREHPRARAASPPLLYV